MATSTGHRGTHPRDQIAKEFLRVHQESYGTSVGNVDVHLHDDLVVVLLDKLELQASEKTFLDGGRHDVVANTRAVFQEEIEPAFTAIVERATGRRVTSFLSNTCLGTLYSVEIFRLAS